MKILHTSDWHLGQYFHHKDRTTEHQLALDWLRQTIIEQGVEALIVAGDIFDVGNPSNQAREIYYRFIASLSATPCRHVVIIGGNHDSPSMLAAPRELLAYLNVHVVSDASENIAEEVLVLNNYHFTDGQKTEGKPELVVAAVPFLRDRYLRNLMTGESGYERVQRIREGIARHYQQIGEEVTKYADWNIPIIATGHLYATGAKTHDAQKNIFLSDTQNIAAKDFPAVFDYVALGHIHRAQIVGNQQNIRYSGSLVPVSFSEIQDRKLVQLLHFEGKQLTKIEEIKVPRFRELVSFSGNLKTVQNKLKNFDEKRKGQLKPWVEIQIDNEDNLPDINGILREYCKNFWMEILIIRNRRSSVAATDWSVDLDLEELSPEDVFLKKCKSQGEMPTQTQQQLVASFRELLNWMQQQE